MYINSCMRLGYFSAMGCMIIILDYVNILSKLVFIFSSSKNKSMLNTSFEGICCFNQENCFRLFQLQKFISTLGIYCFEE